MLILIQKPGKPKGPLTSVRPIVLLTTLRKTLSLFVLSRIAPKVDEYLSPSQSGFRSGRSTADVLFGYRWLCAKAQRQRVSIELLGVDLSRAFDTIRRDKLLDILQTFLGESEMRIIRLLLADTSLEPRLSTGECHAFATSIGMPQWDSLSPVLFTVYLEAALRDLRSRLPTRPQTNANLPLDVEYADDTDFISTSRLFLDDIERIAPACLAEWSLTINASKTERSSVCRHADRVDEEWRMTCKLGSLLGEAEDVARRKQLANVAFRKLSTVWFRRSRISLPVRLRLYESFVVPVLIYNRGTWGLDKGRTRSPGRIPPSPPTPDHLTGRTASRTLRFIAAVDVTPSAKTLNRRDGVCSDTCYACHGTHPLSKRSTTISPTHETPHSEGVHERLCLPQTSTRFAYSTANNGDN